MPTVDTYFLAVSAQALLRVPTKDSFRGNKSENLAFLGYFFSNKNGGVRPKRLKCLL